MLSVKSILILFFILVFVLSVLGGALGNSFGNFGGFLGGPVPFISVPAEKVIELGSYKLLNSTIMFWFAGFILMLIVWLGTKNINQIPNRMQGLLEVIFEFFSNLCDTVAGGGVKSGRRFLPLVVIIFLVVLFSNWVGIIPGVGSIGQIETLSDWVHHKEHQIESEITENYPNLNHEDHKFLIDLKILSKDETFVVFDGPWVHLGMGEKDRVPIGALANFDADKVDKVYKKIKSDYFITSLDQSLNSGDMNFLKELHESLHNDIEIGKVIKNFDLVGNSNYNNWDKHEGKTAGLLVPFFRGANTDLNTPLAIAIFVIIVVQFWGFKALGFKSYAGKFFVNPISKGPINSFVGILEFLGEFTRVVSFTFRLFGNMFAGEILLIAMAFLFPLIGIIPFMGMELFVGAIQAFIFAMLTLFFGVMAVASHEGHDSDSEDH
ncbi:MAG: hypothetical protein CL780_04615 [Chloroflexi bacterium]|nr:hypothetical protein [Chloroflexota bacterium]